VAGLRPCHSRGPATTARLVEELRTHVRPDVLSFRVLNRRLIELRSQISRQPLVIFAEPRLQHVISLVTYIDRSAVRSDRIHPHISRPLVDLTSVELFQKEVRMDAVRTSDRETQIEKELVGSYFFSTSSVSSSFSPLRIRATPSSASMMRAVPG
jgi:hypothetical protein